MLAFLDTETTGLDASRDSIIEVAAVRWENGRILDKWESLVKPHAPVPQEITLLTGIRNEDVVGAPLFSEIKEKLTEFLGDAPVVGHNIAFDMGFLKSHHLALPNAQIDTVHLARILLLKESSYALEVLMKKYGLPLRNSHRAMADTATAVAFFEFLLKKIAEIPAPVKQKVAALLAKSDWAGKQVFQPQTPTTAFFATGGLAAPAAANRLRSRPGRPSPKGEGTKPARAAKAVEKSCVAVAAGFEKFLAGQKMLVETSASIPLEMLAGRPTAIAYSSQRARDELLVEAEAHSLRSCVLKEPALYLSPRRLAQRLSAEKIPTEETPFLLKMLLWREETETGDREELSLEREEYGLWETVCDEDGTDVFFQKALCDAQESDIILIHQVALAGGLLAKCPRENLIIAEAGRLEDNFTWAFRKRLTESKFRPFFGGKSAMLFGLLGIFFEKFSETDAGGYRGNVFMNEETSASQEWQRFFAAAENLPAHKQKDYLLKALASGENKVAWVSSYQNEISFNSAPVSLSHIFHQAVVPAKNVLVTSSALSSGGSFHLIRELFELDSTWMEETLRQAQGDNDVMLSLSKHHGGNLNIKIPEDIPEPYSSGYFKRCEKLFLSLIQEHKGRCLFLMSSKKAVAAMYQSLLPKMPKETRLLALGPTGGAGKSVALFLAACASCGTCLSLENPKAAALITTNQILPYLPEIEKEIEVIVFQKIPFDPPDDPILSARGKMFDNSFEQYTLPRAVIRFKELLKELGKSGKPKKDAEPQGSFDKLRMTDQKTCYLLDSRLRTRNYSALFFS